jgi:hypothetical protein
MLVLPRGLVNLTALAAWPVRDAILGRKRRAERGARPVDRSTPSADVDRRPARRLVRQRRPTRHCRRRAAGDHHGGRGLLPGPHHRDLLASMGPWRLPAGTTLYVSDSMSHGAAHRLTTGQQIRFCRRGRLRVFRRRRPGGGGDAGLAHASPSTAWKPYLAENGGRIRRIAAAPPSSRPSPAPDPGPAATAARPLVASLTGRAARDRRRRWELLTSPTPATTSSGGRCGHPGDHDDRRRGLSVA